MESLFREGFPQLFHERITADSHQGKKTLEKYNMSVEEGFQHLDCLCENSNLYMTVNEYVMKKCRFLDKLADRFLLNSTEMMIFKTEEDAKELIQIMLLDVKVVIIENAIQAIEDNILLRQSKRDSQCIKRELSDYTPTSSTKKRRPNLPVHAKDILSSWFREHVDHPYPTQTEKMELSEMTSLSIQKVDNWFINERSRKWQTYKQK